MDAFELKAPEGATTARRRVGRGNGSGLGKTCGRGSNGQNSRSGGGVRPGFEGGQMPLYRRIARRGFSNYPFRKEVGVVNISQLDAIYKNGDEVTLESLREHGLVKGYNVVKILGDGEITKKLTVKVDSVSASAKEKILKAGGSVVEPAAE